MHHLHLKITARTCLGFAIALVMAAALVRAQRRIAPGGPTSFDDVVFAIAISPDEQTVAIARGAAEPAQRFGRIELWDSATGKLRHVIKGFDGPIKAIAFSADGRTIVSGSAEYYPEKIQQKPRSREGITYTELKWWSTDGELKRKVSLGEGTGNLFLTYSPKGTDLLVAESFMHFSFVNLSPIGGPANTNVPLVPNAPYARPLVFYTSSVKLLDAETAEVKSKLTDHVWNTISYSPDGSLIAISSDKVVRLLNAQTGKEEQQLKGFKGRPNAIAFSRDGRQLAVASMRLDQEPAGHLIRIIGNSQIRVFDTTSWKELRKVADVGAVNTLAFSPTGKVLLMGGVMQQHGEADLAGISLLNMETGRISTLTTGDNFNETVNSLLVFKDGSQVAFRSGQLEVNLFDSQTWTRRQTWDAHSIGDLVERPVSRFLVSAKRVLAIAFSADGTTVTGETDQGEIKLWDPRTGEVKGHLETGQADPAQVSASADGRIFVETSDTANVSYWNFGQPDKQTVSTSAGGPISAVAANKWIAVSTGATITVLGGNDATGPKTIQGRHGSISRLALSRDGEILAASSADGTVDIWNTSSGLLQSTIVVGQPITALDLSPNGQILAAADTRRITSLWSVKAGQLLKKFAKHDGVVNTVAFSADGRMIATGSDDRTAVILEVASGKEIHTLKGHDQTVSSLAFSADGKLLACGTGNASVVIWEVHSGKFTRVLR